MKARLKFLFLINFVLVSLPCYSAIDEAKETPLLQSTEKFPYIKYETVDLRYNDLGVIQEKLSLVDQLSIANSKVEETDFHNVNGGPTKFTKVPLADYVLFHPNYHRKAIAQTSKVGMDLKEGEFTYQSRGVYEA
mgnify:CR=1 FL=1